MAAEPAPDQHSPAGHGAAQCTPATAGCAPTRPCLAARDHQRTPDHPRTQHARHATETTATRTATSSTGGAD